MRIKLFLGWNFQSDPSVGWEGVGTLSYQDEVPEGDISLLLPGSQSVLIKGSGYISTLSSHQCDREDFIQSR